MSALPLGQTGGMPMAHPLPPHPDHRSTNREWLAYHDALPLDDALWSTLPVDRLERDPASLCYWDHRRCPTCGCLMSRPVDLIFLDIPTDQRPLLYIPPGYTYGEVAAAAVLQTMERTGGNKSRTAELLGISRRALYDWLGKLDARIPIHPRGPYPPERGRPRSQES